MTTIKTINKTILVQLNKIKNSTKNYDTDNLRSNLLKEFTAPFTNVLIDFNEIDEINKETMDALIAGQRLSKMNQGQLSLFNVKERVFNAFTQARVAHMFFFCDLPKPLSKDLVMA